MSVQFGAWNFDGAPIDQSYLERATVMISPHGPDADGSYMEKNISIHYHAFHTTSESRRESQPHAAASGAVITWDGRLDNRTDLIRQFKDVLTTNSTDASIVAATYDKWGVECLAHLIGDWALSIWNPYTRCLLLAKDPIGTRHLYYSFNEQSVLWSTILDPVVLLAGKSFALDEEYVAGWLSFFPAPHLSPYVGIRSVPPASSALIRPRHVTVQRYWNFDPEKTVSYRTDSQYEEHFRAVFAEAVRRRLRSDSPILAELSGGMDSSSIVCVADAVLAREVARTPRLDTVSYYSNSEPNWDERPYFTKVEEQRAQVGCHIDAGLQVQDKLDMEPRRFAATPASICQPSAARKQFAAYVKQRGSRVVLSGIGGDEVTGGVPTPTPELQDLLVGIRLRTLAQKLKLWALSKRKPWVHLFLEAAREFYPLPLVGVPASTQPQPCLNKSFAERNRRALGGYESRLTFFGPRPSFQGNLKTLGALQRQITCETLSPIPLYEKRYPYLDRDLLEFLYAIPREQLVRPGERRSLMRRALVGIVPKEILDRRRKAYASRAPIQALAAEHARLSTSTTTMALSSLGIIDSQAFCDSLQRIQDGTNFSIVPLTRVLILESWLQTMTDRGVLVSNSTESRRQPSYTAREQPSQGRVRYTKSAT